MEGETERICCRLTVPIPIPHCTACGMGSERSEVVPGRGRGKMFFCFIACLRFSLPESIFIGNT